MSKKHTPRRSGVGQRQATKPAKVREKKRRRPTMLPAQCGAKHPELPYTCSAGLRFVDGKEVRHAGQHRARPLVGIVFRWADSEVPA